MTVNVPLIVPVALFGWSCAIGLDAEVVVHVPVINGKWIRSSMKSGNILTEGVEVNDRRGGCWD